MLTSPGDRAAGLGRRSRAADLAPRCHRCAPAALLLALALVRRRRSSPTRCSTTLQPRAHRALQELASIGSRFAGRGPALFTDFDEYALYVLRDLDVGGPDFVNPPPRCGVPPATAAVSTSTGVPHGAALLPADRHPPRPRRRPAAVRLQPAVAGHLLPGVGSSPQHTGSARPRRTVPRPARQMRSRGKPRATGQIAQCTAG